MVAIAMTVNGKAVSGDVEPRTLLVDFIRQNLKLTGTHVGCDTSQCGFCTPGMIMSAADLLQKNPSPSETEVREWLEGNICRCTGYHNIVKSILAASETMKAAAE